MNDRAKFTATVVVGDKFKEVFDNIVKIPMYHNCGKIVSTSYKFLLVCIDTEPRGYVDASVVFVSGTNAIDVIIEGDAKFVKEMMLMINDALKNHGFSLIDGKYEVSI